MRLLAFLFRKLFLVKEIISQEGNVHFRRYRIVSTPWFNLFLHEIRRSDEDRHMHDHPWSFQSLILLGSYSEKSRNAHLPNYIRSMSFIPGDVNRHDAEDFHSLTLHTPVVWTLVLTSGRGRVWGYQTSHGWIDHQTYRALKRANQLPQG